jgi:hypothetical protein
LGSGAYHRCAAYDPRSLWPQSPWRHCAWSQRQQRHSGGNALEVDPFLTAHGPAQLELAFERDGVAGKVQMNKPIRFQCSPKTEALMMDRLWSVQDLVPIVDESKAAQKAENREELH